MTTTTEAPSQGTVGRKVRAGVLIELGLISLTADLHSAVETDGHLNTVCRQGHDPAQAKQQLKCPICDRTDGFEKGAPVGSKSFVIVPPEALAKVAEIGEAAFTEIRLRVYRAADFSVHPSGASYFLSAPRQPDHYVMLAALIIKRPDLLFVGEFTMRKGSAPGLYALGQDSGTLMLIQLCRPDMVRARPEVSGTVHAPVVEAAERFVDAMVETYDPTTYINQRRAILSEAIANATPSRAANVDNESGGGDVFDLMAKLNAAMEKTVEKKPAAKKVPAKKAVSSGVPQPRKTATAKTAAKKVPVRKVG